SCANPAAPTPLRPGRADRGEPRSPRARAVACLSPRRPWRRLLVPGGFACRNGAPPPGCGPLGSPRPDAPIATTAELAPAAGPCFPQAKDLAATPHRGADELEPLPGRPGHRGRVPGLADRRDRALLGRARGDPGLLQSRGIALERLGPIIQRPGRRLY